MSHALDGATLRIERAVRHFDEFENEFSTFRKSNIDKVSIAGGAYVATLLVAMYAPLVRSATCRRASINALRMQVVAWIPSDDTKSRIHADN
jgi:hypothetical protein